MVSGDHRQAQGRTCARDSVACALTRNLKMAHLSACGETCSCLTGDLPLLGNTPLKNVRAGVAGSNVSSEVLLP